MTFNKLTLTQRVQAANIDCMRHPKFALLSSIICMGVSEVRESVRTAQTNGRDKFYGVAFCAPLNRKQMRYLVLHENFHCALKHCTNYKAAQRAYPNLTNVAQDYIINGLIEEMDPNFDFVERPTEGLLINKAYNGMSFPQVFNLLLKKNGGKDYDPPEPRKPGDKHDPTKPEPLDVHEPMEFDDDDEAADHERAIDDALVHGGMLARRLAGKGAGGADIIGPAAQRTTDYVAAMRDWITDICKGDDQSRFCPPNKRLLASGFLMPSRFTESTGVLVVAADTSGSMGPYYQQLFGEVARLCEQVRPERVHMLWWDTAVCSVQEFTPQDYDQIATLLKPAGGGGTEPQVVVDYLRDKKIEARGIVWLTDGYLGCDTPDAGIPALWGVLNNDHFVASHGKTLHISI